MAMSTYKLVFVVLVSALVCCTACGRRLLTTLPSDNFYDQKNFFPFIGSVGGGAIGGGIGGVAGVGGGIGGVGVGGGIGGVGGAGIGGIGGGIGGLGGGIGGLGTGGGLGGGLGLP